MKLAVCVAAALAIADATSARLLAPAEHPAGHLFVRGDSHVLPVRQYGGVDPQADQVAKRKVAEEAAMQQSGNVRRFHHDHLNVLDLAPRDFEKRQAPTKSSNLGVDYPPAGNEPPNPKLLPQAWVDKYNEVKKAGLIPDIPMSTADPTKGVVYPSGTDLNKACSWTATKCDTGDIYQAPDDNVAFGIDDGPTPSGTPRYLTTLKDANVSATHFLIGSAIMWNMPTFQQLASATPQQHLGVHTWSHTVQSSKSDLEVLGDLGWVQQIIYDYTGYIPAYWRPPEGDVDARVRAIAKYVLGMQTVLWTKDADDWCLREGTGTASSIASCKSSAPDLETVQKVEVGWASPKTNSTGWISLNHETTDQAAKAFSAMVDAAKKSGWTIAGNIPDLQGLNWYSNAYAKGDKGTKQDNILPTKAFINVTDPTAKKGSAQAPNLGDWAKTATTSDNSNAAKQGGGSSSYKSATSGAGSLAGPAVTTIGATALFSMAMALLL